MLKITTTSNETFWLNPAHIVQVFYDDPLVTTDDRGHDEVTPQCVVIITDGTAYRLDMEADDFVAKITGDNK